MQMSCTILTKSVQILHPHTSECQDRTSFKTQTCSGKNAKGCMYHWNIVIFLICSIPYSLLDSCFWPFDGQDYFWKMVSQSFIASYRNGASWFMTKSSSLTSLSLDTESDTYCSYQTKKSNFRHVMQRVFLDLHYHMMSHAIPCAKMSFQWGNSWTTIVNERFSNILIQTKFCKSLKYSLFFPCVKIL